MICPVHGDEDLVCGVAVRLEERILRDRIKVLEDAVLAADKYFAALAAAWARNEGRLISESGVFTEGSEEIESLGNLAGQKIGEVALTIPRLGIPLC